MCTLRIQLLKIFVYTMSLCYLTKIFAFAMDLCNQYRNQRAIFPAFNLSFCKAACSVLLATQLMKIFVFAMSLCYLIKIFVFAMNLFNQC